ncbi:copper chaperone CopZ [Phocicoccus pinnipedialis]|uniref:Copper chaperone CopZ n=1 Tax=Phocicoccus pinnipedialis TaxID=110845 RepID=A0A6V7R5B4_9BACL|nr:copper chaperone CopZ [Jeotgalicoccus pinnipedialis]MBP1939980.1 copper chaperone [Jeotgalicoccus pinnipedialis]CAD2072072.1 Copper chaperone CopZ [Jeotgalicoccus pinnipedialis]
MEQVIKVEGMTCGHCKSAVEGALSKLDGVKSANVDLENKNVTVDFDDSKVSLVDMETAIEDQGYDVEK